MTTAALGVVLSFEGPVGPSAMAHCRKIGFDPFQEGEFIVSPYTFIGIAYADEDDEPYAQALAVEIATQSLLKRRLQGLMPTSATSRDLASIIDAVIARYPLRVTFMSSVQQKQREKDRLYVLGIDERTVEFSAATPLVAWCVADGRPESLELALWLTQPLGISLRARVLAADIQAPASCVQVNALRLLRADTAMGLVQYGIEMAKLGNRVEAEQARAVAHTLSDVPVGAIRTIAPSLGLCKTWQSAWNTTVVPAYVSEMVSGEDRQVLRDPNDASAGEWAHRARIAAKYRLSVAALLAARRAIALGDPSAAEIAAQACRDLQLTSSAAAYEQLLQASSRPGRQDDIFNPSLN
ncbi:MAG: hypothetical protein N2690_02170 [Rhodocyclaceae bacterium]|nr:hypothetical protein [Rhodocyclaceae bacterium]